MTRKWAHWTVVALAATLVAVAAQAKETEAEQPQTQVEVRMQQPGEEPAARIWINGKEVKPGEPISADALGQINVQTFVDTDGAEGGKAGAGASSGQVSVRVEARADKPGEQPKVRMWVNGKEVDPGKDVELDDKGQVRAYSFARPGRKRDEDSDKGGGVLGVMISPLDEETAEKADVKAGAVVGGTTPGSAAEKAGLKEATSSRGLTASGSRHRSNSPITSASAAPATASVSNGPATAAACARPSSWARARHARAAARSRASNGRTNPGRSPHLARMSRSEPSSASWRRR